MEAAALEPAPAEIVEAQTVEAAPDIPLDRIPLPTPRPKQRPVETVRQDKPVEQAAPKPRKETKLAEAQKPAKKPAAKPAKARQSGNAGKNESDAQRGQADGRANGRTAANSKGGKNSAAGNAAVSNYPGKVASKLRRALRYPAEAKRQRLRGQAQVSFVVSASGGVGSIRLVSSSGSPILDRAAIETVRRAAPFPAIPAGAARSSWPFTVPLAFNR
jgi:protein TonB